MSERVLARSAKNSLLCTAMAAALAVAIVPTSAIAQSEADRLAALEAQIQLLMREIEGLKAAQAASSPPAPAPASASVAVAPQGVANVPQGSVAADLVALPQRPGAQGNPFHTSLPEGRVTAPIATGTDSFRLTFSGWMNPAVTVSDDGESTNSYFVSNENASNRFRFIGNSPEVAGTQALMNFEFEWLSNSSLGANQTQQNGAVWPPGSNSASTDIRRRLLEVGFTNDRFGTIWLGHGWTASDNTMENNLSNATDASWASQHFAFGGLLFTDEDTGGFARRPAGSAALPNILASTSDRSLVNLFSVADSLDGLSRRDRVRYDSPVLGGFQLSGSAGSDFYDVGLRYAGSTDWAQFVAAAQYHNDESNGAWGDYDGYGASGSLLLRGSEQWWDGLNFTASGGRREFDDFDNEPVFLFGQVGYRAKLVDWGETAFALAYHDYDEFALKDESAKMYGGGVVQHFDRFGATAYMSLYNAELDSPDFRANDLLLFQFGSRVRF